MTEKVPIFPDTFYFVLPEYVINDFEDVKCNCDAGEEMWRLDEGTLTDRRHLPVTKLNFGNLEEDTQQARFLLGPLYCQGASRPPSVMTSCQVRGASIDRPVARNSLIKLIVTI